MSVRDEDKIWILFVCMGNLCRSPAAEGIFRHMLRENDMLGYVEVDSAGTHGYHSGEPPDLRMRQAASARGYDLEDLVARRFEVEDFLKFDVVLAMDRENVAHLRRGCPPQFHGKIRLFLEFVRSPDGTEVPDPYNGTEDDFETVLNMLEPACDTLIKRFRRG